MRNTWVFGLVTFAGLWLLQIVSDHLLSPALPSPQWMLLAVLALGGLGRTNLAQTLGFFLGLSLDVYGLSLFGAQGGLLACAGFLTGCFSRQLNAEKFVTQETLAFLGTVFFGIGLLATEVVFRAGHSRMPGVGTLGAELLLNLLAAPVMFWVVRFWVDLFETEDERRVAGR